MMLLSNLPMLTSLSRNVDWLKALLVFLMVLEWVLVVQSEVWSVIGRQQNTDSLDVLVLIKFVWRLGWRWAFLMQMPLFFISIGLTQYHLRYVTPVRVLWPFWRLLWWIIIQGRSKSAKEVLKRIDYGGSLTLLVSVSLVCDCSSWKCTNDLVIVKVGSFLVFLSTKYNEERQVRSSLQLQHFELYI